MPMMLAKHNLDPLYEHLLPSQVHLFNSRKFVMIVVLPINNDAEKHSHLAHRWWEIERGEREKEMNKTRHETIILAPFLIYH